MRARAGASRRRCTEVHFTEWNCRAGQNNVIIRTDGTVAPCFPMYPASYDWGNIDTPKFEAGELREIKNTCSGIVSPPSTTIWHIATTMPGS